MAFVGSNNALAWAHFRLRGGWPRSLAVAGGAFLLLGALIVTMVQLSGTDRDRAEALWGWTIGLLAIQTGCVVIYIPARISSEIKSDTQSKMMESHRLMPLPPAHAVAGYVMGAAMQPLVFFGGMFLLGALVASASGVQLPRWAFANAVLLVFAMFVWIIGVYSALGGRIGGAVMGAMIVVPWFTQGYVLSLLPGTTVLLSPVIGQSVFDFRGSGFTVPPTYAIAFAAQFGFATLCFIGAAREYRRPGEVSLDTMLAMGFFLGWVIISLAALRGWEDFRPRGWNPGRAETPVQVCASMLAALLLAVGVVAANARERIRWRRHVAIADPYPRRRPLPIALIIAIAVAAMLTIPFAPPSTANPMRPTLDLLSRTIAIIAIALIGLYFFFEVAYSFMKKAFGVAIIWLVLTWGAGIIIDGARYAIFEQGQSLDVFSKTSPIGALMMLWTRHETDIRLGIGVQIALAIIPMCVWLLTAGRSRSGAELAAGYKPPPRR
jgi:hypothetical protein